MNKVYFIYNRYYDFENKIITIGGIQTYISELEKICKEIGFDTTIVQYGKKEDSTCCDGKRIIQYAAESKKEFEKQVQKKLMMEIDIENDVIIFMTHTIIFNTIIFKNSIAIQHGVSWDVPANKERKFLKAFLGRNYRSYKRIRDLRKASKIVCVDYNFLNWIRTHVDFSVNHFEVIPNFTKIAKRKLKSDETIKIIFARRLYDYRGTRIFTNAILRLLKEENNVQIIIAGTGDDERWMKERLEKYQNVSFICYKSEESLTIHEDKHIAVVPTIGSEGTSLSLLEAMSAQCAVVCTNVGGMTNIIIDGYNGLMVFPEEEELYNAIKRLIQDKKLREDLSNKAYDTVTKGFSFENWKKKWINLLKQYLIEESKN